MALNAAGYTAAGAGTAAANGNYIPVTGAYATWNGATQYTNGTDFLAYLPTPGSPEWGVSSIVNSTYNSFYLLYYGGTSASLTNMPLTGWAVNQGAAPAPTFTTISGAAPASAPRLQPRVVVF